MTHGENTFYSDVVAHFANSEAFFVSFARDADNYTAILLDTFFVALFNTVCNCDGVAGTEFGMLLAGSVCFLKNFY